MPSITNLIDEINDLIGSGAKPGILRGKLTFLREQAEAFEQEYATLIKEKKGLEKQNSDLQSQIATFQSPVSEPEGTEICPYCNKISGVLDTIKPHPHFGKMGVKIYYYKCSNPKCGKDYDKQIDP